MSAASRRVTAEISRLLQVQNDALRAGRLDTLAALVPQLQKAIERLGPDIDRPTPELSRLRRTAARNAELLAAAQDGLRRARMIRDRAAAPALTTYGADGRVAPPPSGAGRTLSRR
ncbi:hypothetical protein N8I71_02020 [Roseibacterium sp. SDUM158016]|jgi:hypothetical protein|uniref:hypothetical protein n=1 Tax=Roseicyclus sediminis TaxID=2980997 RepID=UPI0021D1EC38|nr:hypothetical protein [Roseibacterium sp. SDUM158016]MCU4651588.1 hypothetical protein [Roseibacterium sp. SDUM158016]